MNGEHMDKTNPSSNEQVIGAPYTVHQYHQHVAICDKRGYAVAEIAYGTGGMPDVYRALEYACAWRDRLNAKPVETTCSAADYEAVLTDHRRLVRELDVALNGDGAALQASLCDIVAQVNDKRWRLVSAVGPRETSAHRTDARLAGDIEYCLAKIIPATDVHAILTEVMKDLRGVSK